MKVQNMAGAPGGVSLLPAEPPAAAVGLFEQLIASAESGPPGMGQALLQGLDGLHRRLEADWSTVQALGTAGQPSAVELLQAQLKIVGASFQCDLLAKVVAKSEQNVEQLVKMQ
ncbi:type III secretion system inner rod subunit SctI [Rugamonas aquatica]|uniref:EscI/YscI/HrpB family type III secretion system inner rod protein n=1 Tax=Rugamonas aquatica TaxID=2743357 RepID=A0A6A7N712_9BURK|nr:type III secretion system inner rod subunit SctI [Rugamonas aquatica]MQA40731.1 EscI/YscI/HrpB family type III secretion system inner rod protein [Rugamonas aquatica]